MKKTLISLLVATLLHGSSLAVAQETDPMNANERTINDRLINITGQIQSINQELSSQRAAIGSMNAELSAQARESDEFRRDILKEIKALRRQNQSLVDSFTDLSAQRASDNMQIKPLRNYDLQTPDGKMYFGEDEYIYIKEADATIDARIDTGAAVSSISATDITEFERQGKKWYRFTIDANDHNITVEAPFVRTSTIRQSSKETTTERVVVSLTVKIGEFSTQSEFTLTDRTSMQYPLLIGRTLIQDIAVVDVSRDHIQARNTDTFLILSRKQYESNLEKGIDVNKEFKAKQAQASSSGTTGQVAYPSQDYGANLGTNSENALPVVRNAKSEVKTENAPEVQKATPVKAKPVETKTTPEAPVEAKPETVTEPNNENNTKPESQDDPQKTDEKKEDTPKADANKEAAPKDDAQDKGAQKDTAQNPQQEVKAESNSKADTNVASDPKAEQTGQGDSQAENK